VGYLLQARQISNEDAQLILSKVPQPIHVDPAPAPPTALIQPGSSLQLTNLPTPILNANIQPVATPPAHPPHPPQAQSGGAAVKRAVPPPPKKVQARALWDYNIDGDVRDRDPVLPLPDVNPFNLCLLPLCIPITMSFSKYPYILIHACIATSPRSPSSFPVTLAHTSTHASRRF